MANLNIFGKDWTNIVFEGRNKLYGAYVLRRDSGKNTLFALLLGIVFIGGLFAGKTAYDKIYQNIQESRQKDMEAMEGVEVVLPEPEEIEPPVEEIKKEEPPVEPPKGDASKSVQDEKEFTEVQVKKDSEVTKQAKTSQEDFNDNTNSGRADREGDKDKGDFKSDGTQTGGADKGSQGTGMGNQFQKEKTEDDDPNKIHRVVQVKAQPMNGDINDFRLKFANKYNAPEVSSGVNQIRVTLKYVVEKDGSFTDIQANPNDASGKEAIRVLKSMPKWKPAEQNGKPVRSSFTLPIVIKVNN